MLDKKFFIKLGANVRDKYRKHIFAKARDVFGKSFKGYSKDYGEAKRGNKFKGQRSKFKGTTAPVLTGQLLNDFGSHFVPKQNGVELGWSVQGAKVKWLAKLGRVLTTPNQPLPKGIVKYIEVQASSYIKKKMKPKKKTTKYVIGK